MWQAARLGSRILAGLFVAGAVVQFFLAGLGVFGTGAALLLALERRQPPPR
jgi:hypothetical protein